MSEEKQRDLTNALIGLKYWRLNKDKIKQESEEFDGKVKEWEEKLKKHEERLMEDKKIES